MAAKPKSVSTLSKQLSEVGDRIKMRKQTDLRDCHSLATSLLTVVRVYQNAKKTGFKKDSMAKVDAAIEKVLVTR